jgi:hypothetical protein
MRGVGITVQSGGTVNRRTTFTRAAVMGPFAVFAPKKLNDRDLSVVVDGPDFQWSIQADPKYGPQVRDRVAPMTTTLREWQAAQCPRRRVASPRPPMASRPVPVRGPRSLDGPTVRMGPSPSATSPARRTTRTPGPMNRPGWFRELRRYEVPPLLRSLRRLVRS